LIEITNLANLTTMHAFQSFIEVCRVKTNCTMFLKKRKILPYVEENNKYNTTKSYYDTCYDQIYDDEHIMSMKTRNKTQQNPITIHVMLY